MWILMPTFQWSVCQPLIFVFSILMYLRLSTGDISEDTRNIAQGGSDQFDIWGSWFVTFSPLLIACLFVVAIPITWTWIRWDFASLSQQERRELPSGTTVLVSFTIFVCLGATATMICLHLSNHHKLNMFV